MSDTPRFFQLHNLHYGYLGEDWPEDYGDVETALAAYLAEEDLLTLRRTVQEADDLLAAGEFLSVCQQLTQYFRPDSWTEADMRAWIRHLRDSAATRLGDRPPSEEAD